MILSSCYSSHYVSKQGDYKEVLIGKDYSYVVNTFGAPTRQTPDGNNGTILVYESHSSKSVATAYNVNYYSGTYTPGVETTTYTDYVHIFINSENICYNVKTNHTKKVKEPNVGATTLSILGIAAVIATTIYFAAYAK